MATTPPSTPPGYSGRLDRDMRLRILTLRDVGFTYQQIVDHLGGITYRQVQYTCQAQTATPRKARGQPSKVTSEQVDEVIKLMNSSKGGRQMSYREIINELNLGVSPNSLARALQKRGIFKGR